MKHLFFFFLVFWAQFFHTKSARSFFFFFFATSHFQADICSVESQDYKRNTTSADGVLRFHFEVPRVAAEAGKMDARFGPDVV